jgi:hypothetical protein
MQYINEAKRWQKLAGIITENTQEVTPEQATQKAVSFASQLEKSPAIDKLADKISNDPSLMAQLEKALSQSGIQLNEVKLDSTDMKTLALSFAKKAEEMKEGISSDPEADDTSAGLSMAAGIVGGTLGAYLSPALIAALPALASIVAGPAVFGAIAGIALFVIARKIYLAANPDL